MSNLQSFFPRLLSSALLLAGLGGMCGAASADVGNLVQNGGFETGDFSSWTPIGESTFNGVQCPGPGAVPELNCNAFFGPVGTTGGIEQSIATDAGALYLISFIFKGDGTAGDFIAAFGGANLVTLVDPAAEIREFSFQQFAPGVNTVLRFQFRDDAGFMELDAVRVSVVAEPASMALLSLGLVGVGVGVSVSRRRGRR